MRPAPVRGVAGLLLALLSLPAPLPARAADPSLACGAPAELLEAGIALPATARAVQQGQLRILVLGSASVFGPGTSGPDAAWPQRMQVLLGRRFPGLDVQLTVR